MKINNTFIARFLLYYLLLTTAHHFFQSDVLKKLIFFMITGQVIIFTAFIIRNIRFVPKKIIPLFCIYSALLLLNYIFNIENSDISLTLKYFGIFIIFLVGYIINIKNPCEEINIKPAIFLILTIPLIVYLYDTFILNKPESGSVFINRNSAVVYGVISSYLILIFFQAPKSFYANIFINIILYKTLGALLASIFGFLIIYISNISLKNILLLASTLFSIAVTGTIVYLYMDITIFERLKNAASIFDILLSQGSFDSMANVSYAEIVSESGSEDLSTLFRIKHWFNIINLYSEFDYITVFFGRGNDSIAILTDAKLRAHNDYLRILFEVGIFFLISFIALHIYIIRKIGLNIYLLPMLVVLIYYNTDNLLDNFQAILMLYYMLGLIAAQRKLGALNQNIKAT